MRGIISSHAESALLPRCIYPSGTGHFVFDESKPSLSLALPHSELTAEVNAQLLVSREASNRNKGKQNVKLDKAAR